MYKNFILYIIKTILFNTTVFYCKNNKKFCKGKYCFVVKDITPYPQNAIFGRSRVYKSRFVLIEVVSFQVNDGLVPQGGGGSYYFHFFPIHYSSCYSRVYNQSC
jgi:hypothetical protein